jgi:hypothetical protein
VRQPLAEGVAPRRPRGQAKAIVGEMRGFRAERGALEHGEKARAAIKAGRLVAVLRMEVGVPRSAVEVGQPNDTSEAALRVCSSGRFEVALAQPLGEFAGDRVESDR